MSKQRRRPGNFLAIPLGEGRFAFGREQKETIVFYNKQSDHIVSIESLEDTPIAFTLAVHDAPIKSSRWTVVGNRPLEARFLFAPKFFREDPMNGTIDIYKGGEFFPWSGEDLSKLERLAVWSAEKVEERLRNHFQGLPDPQTESFKYRGRTSR